MEVYLTQESRYEVDEEKIFVIYEDEWETWKEENGDDKRSQENFLLNILWQIVPYFEEVGGIETYDDARIDIFFVEDKYANSRFKV